MKETFTAYLKDLDMGDNFVRRVTELHDECRLLTDEEPEEIFVSEQFVEGQRKYIALHFFTQSSVFRFRDFISQFNVEIHRLEGVALCEFHKREFDLKTGSASPKSTVVLNVTWEPLSFSLQLVATQDNCAHLSRIVKKYFFPQLT